VTVEFQISFWVSSDLSLPACHQGTWFLHCAKNLECNTMHSWFLTVLCNAWYNNRPLLGDIFECTGIWSSCGVRSDWPHGAKRVLGRPGHFPVTGFQKNLTKCEVKGTANVQSQATALNFQCYLRVKFYLT
jgi:hypothetical protein